MSPRYSLVIPAYNDAVGLARTFAFFESCNTPVQIVVVDDCSTDDTEQMVAQAQLPATVTLIYHRQDINQGPGAARNLGIQLATSERLLFLDADDVLSPVIFDILDQVTLTQDFVLFKYHLATHPDRLHTYDMHHVDRRFFSNMSLGRFPVESQRLQNCPTAAATVNFPWNKLYRRSFLLEQKIQFPDQRMHEDILFHWQCFLRCTHFGVLNWAPPLLTHFELPATGRATQYVGPKRLEAVELLFRVEEELLAHPHAAPLIPVFSEFCDTLFNWMITELKQDEDGQSWAAQYTAAAEGFWEQARVPRPIPPTPQDAI